MESMGERQHNNEENVEIIITVIYNKLLVGSKVFQQLFSHYIMNLILFCFSSIIVLIIIIEYLAGYVHVK